MSETPDYITLTDTHAVVTLKRGVTINGTLVKALHMRDPEVGDQLATDKLKSGNVEREIALFANLCEQPVEVIHRLKLADYKRLQEAFQLFLD